MSILTDEDHDLLDVYLKKRLNDYKSGKIEEYDAIASIVHLIAAVDIKNEGELSAILKDSER